MSSTVFRPTPRATTGTTPTATVPPAPRGHRPGVSPRPRTLRRHALHALRRAAPALLAYVAVRTTGLLVLAVWAHRRHEGVWPILATQWDATPRCVHDLVWRGAP